MRRVRFEGQYRTVQFQFLTLKIIVDYVLKEMGLPADKRVDVRVNDELVPPDEYDKNERKVSDDDFVEIRPLT